jgi:hypothetical protein
LQHKVQLPHLRPGIAMASSRSASSRKLGIRFALISAIMLSLLHNRWQWASHIFPIGFDKRRYPAAIFALVHTDFTVFADPSDVVTAVV